MRNPVAALALALAGAALFIALGGPAYAAKAVKQISGSTIKAKSITSKQLADGSVSLPKIAAAARTSLTGAPGAPGAAGPKGATGAPGATGPTGALDVVDAQGHRVGGFAGFYSVAEIVSLDSGAQLIYDGTTANNPVVPDTGPLLYKAAGCTGTPYLAAGTNPIQLGVVLESPPVPGSTIYVKKAGPLQTFTTLSRRTAAGCTNASASSSNVLVAEPAGTVPTVQKPLVLKPAS